MRLTIAVPTIGTSDFILEAVRSALDALPGDSELVLSDNESGSPQPLVAIAESDSRIRLIRQPRRLPMADSWNACLAEARGRYFVLLSDDDRVGPGALDAMASALDRHPGAGFCGVRTELIDAEGRPVWKSPAHPEVEPAFECVEAYFRRRRAFYPCSMMFRTDILRLTGGFDGSFGPAADVAAWMRCSHRTGGVAFAGKFKCSYREHASSLTASTAIVEWQSRIEAIGRLAMSLYGDDCGADRWATRLAGYMSMDLAAKATLASRGGLIKAVRNASRYRHSDPGGFARIAAKCTYYWLRQRVLTVPGRAT